MVTAISAPLAAILCDPSRHYAVYRRCNLQHLKPDSELRILACVSDQSQVPCTIDLLDATHATARSPVAVYLLQLVELVGRSAPVFIPHKLPRSDSSASHRPINAPSAAPENDPVINAFLLLEQHYGGGGAMSVHPFTTISPYSSMHHEVCRLAVEKRAALVLLPFHRRQGLRNVNRQVIHGAPCSVAVLVDRLAADERNVRALARKADDEFAHDVAVLFFGGGDDREALAYAMRMARHPGVTTTVIRFLPSRSVRDDHGERRMDNKALEAVKSPAGRNNKVAYREELVGDMEEIVDVIRGLEERECDMVMVGMRHTWSAVMVPTVEGLSEWSECPELGIIGDFLASSDSGAGNAVLVVKQQDQSGSATAGYTSRPPGEDHSAS